MSGYDTARSLGIRLDSYRLGEHRTVCPKCSHLRKVVNRREKCLAVKIETDMLVWHCWHCGDEGGKRHEDAPPARQNFNRRSIRAAYR